MKDYDKNTLQVYCDALYGAAWLYIGVAALFLGICGYALGELIDHLRPMAKQNIMPATLTVIGSVLGAIFGFAISYSLKVKAQKTLCQMQIEEHLGALVSLFGNEQNEKSAEPQNTGSNTAAE